MTALCTGGTSAPKPGASLITLLASGFAAVALQKYGAGWLQWALPFLSLPELNLTSFCATDPPALPTFTAAESAALVNLTLGADFTSGLSKFGDLLQHLAWYEVCACTSGSLVTYPTAPAPPAGTPVYAPTPAPAVATPCQYVPGWFGAVGGGFASNNATITAGLNATSISVPFQWSLAGAGPHPQQTFTVAFSGPGLPAGTGTRTIAPASNTIVTVTCPVPVGTTVVTLSVSCTPGGTDTSLGGPGRLYCNNQVDGVAPAPCCPPDANTQLALDNLLRMVTLLQRQLVPFAYVDGTTHAGLTGSGSFAVQGLLGVRVNLTTIPAALRQDTSVPPFVFNAGWLSMLDGNGFINEVRVHAASQVWAPPIASDATLVGYSLAPGVVGTIIEIRREP